jgi:hypothetical protein
MNFIAEIPVRKTLRSGIHHVDFKNLEFGKYVSDHMLICDYSNTGEHRKYYLIQICLSALQHLRCIMAKQFLRE